MFSFRAYVKDHIRIGSDSISIPELQEKYPQLAPIKPIHYKYEDVEIIIGQDFYHAIRRVEYLLWEDSISPCAVRLPIGWVLSGPLPPSSNSSCFKCVVEDMSLADQMKTWFELESYGAFKQVDARSAADKRALSVLKNDTFHDGERYIVPMLWNDKESTLPNNYFSSLAQLKSLEKRLAKDPSLRKKYAETIREDVQKGYVITVKAQDPKSRANREWYLPHHPVLNPNKHGKVRRVVNGASKCHGASLNKSLLVGPDLLQNLIFVLLRFRQHKYAVSADIKGMFLQVGVREEDQTSLRFLWREDATSSVVVHQYTRHIYGARDSPTCENFALQKTASDNQAEYPRAASAVVQKICPSILRTTDWPYKPDTKVIDKIRLNGPSCDIDICLEDSSNFVVDVLNEKNLPFEKWERFNSIVKYKRTVAFLLRWLPSHKHFRSSILEITDPCEMDTAEQ